MLRPTSPRTLGRLLPLAFVLFVATSARAAVMPLTAVDLAGLTPITFTGLADGTPINGLTVNGVLFNYLISNVPSTSAVIDGGPGITNNVAPPNIVNLTSNANAILRLTFPAAEVRLGYGFAVLALGAIPNATTVSLYDASNVLVGTLSANGVPDPTFTGGFLGLQSTIPFVRADLAFSTLASAFAVDNIRFAPAAAVPEPATLVLFGIGILSASARRLRKRQR
jgi:hypothetical protein